MSRSRIKLGACALLAATALTACSDIYLDRRETVSISAGDAVHTNKVTHMVDPWPPASANRHIPFNGPKMQTAVERYRTNRVIRPVGMTTTSNSGYEAAAAAVPSLGAPK